MGLQVSVAVARDFILSLSLVSHEINPPCSRGLVRIKDVTCGIRMGGYLGQ